jgi:hypothetical protein
MGHRADRGGAPARKRRDGRGRPRDLSGDTARPDARRALARRSRRRARSSRRVAQRDDAAGRGRAASTARTPTRSRATSRCRSCVAASVLKGVRLARRGVRRRCAPLRAGHRGLVASTLASTWLIRQSSATARWRPTAATAPRHALIVLRVAASRGGRAAAWRLVGKWLHFSPRIATPAALDWPTGTSCVVVRARGAECSRARRAALAIDCRLVAAGAAARHARRVRRRATRLRAEGGARGRACLGRTERVLRATTHASSRSATWRPRRAAPDHAARRRPRRGLHVHRSPLCPPTWTLRSACA